MMSEKIKACPFCGSDSCKVVGRYSYNVECHICGAGGSSAITKDDAVLLWNAATNAIAVKDAEIARLTAACDDLEGEYLRMKDERDAAKAEIARLTAALADTEEQRHETVSKLSLSLIREANGDKRQDELEAEIEKLRESMEFFSENASNYLAERDEARRVARHWYKEAELWR